MEWCAAGEDDVDYGMPESRYLNGGRLSSMRPFLIGWLKSEGKVGLRLGECLWVEEMCLGGKCDGSTCWMSDLEISCVRVVTDEQAE